MRKLIFAIIALSFTSCEDELISSYQEPINKSVEVTDSIKVDNLIKLDVVEEELYPIGFTVNVNDYNEWEN